MSWKSRHSDGRHFKTRGMPLSAHIRGDSEERQERARLALAEADGQLTVKREGYDRKAYTREDGTHVKATHVPPATFKIRDRGAKGRGKKIFKIEKGRMQGYSTSMPERTRHEKLDRLIEKHGAATVWHMLNAQVVLRKNTPGHAKTVFKEDREYVREKFHPDIARSARREWMRMTPKERAEAMPGGKND